MDVKVFAVLFWACATWQISVNANEGCIYEGKQLKKGPFPFETHPNTDTEEKCKDICDSDPLCVIWQWQPKQKKCWIIYPDFKRDANSDFGINNCKDGKPTENAPECKVEKGNREHKLKNHWRMTREECIAICSEDSDCLIWQYFRKERLCQIHKLEVDTTKQSQVGIHYCSSSTQSTCSSCKTCGVPVRDNASRNASMLSRIVGGEPATWTDYPFMVRLEIFFQQQENKLVKKQCSGTFISDPNNSNQMVILTAAHCLYRVRRKPTAIDAMIRFERENNNNLKVNICSYSNHPGFLPTYEHSGNDIAVLTVCDWDHDSVAMNGVIPACLLPRKKNDYYGVGLEKVKLWALGYGRTGPVHRDENLHIVVLQGISNGVCEAKSSVLLPSADMMCAEIANENKGICDGDSGGPLIVENKNGNKYVIGVSNESKCIKGVIKGPSTFARVHVHLKFIKHYKSWNVELLHVMP